MTASETLCSSAYLWYDLEFTSLDMERAELLQVALVITDANLKRLAPPERDLNLYVGVSPQQSLSPWVEENLGFVLAKCRGPEAVPVARVEAQLCATIDAVLGPPSPDIRARPVIAGNSVHADYYLSRRLLPRLLDRCHYRLLDVSVLKLQWHDWFGGDVFNKDDPKLVKQWFPGAALADDGQAHDAYYDVQASIAELAYYRAQLRRSAE